MSAGQTNHHHLRISGTTATARLCRLRSTMRRNHNFQRPSLLTRWTFYNDFEEGMEDKDEEEDDDDDLEDDYDDLEVSDEEMANFRSKMASLFGDKEGGGGDSSSSSSSSPPLPTPLTSSSSPSAVDELIQYARESSSSSLLDEDASSKAPTEWAYPTNEIGPGTVLVANPAKFCADFGNGSSSSGETSVSYAFLGGLTGAAAAAMGNRPNPRLLQKFGLTLPPPADLGADRRADLLPVLLIVDHDPQKDGTLAVLLNRRTGYLLGDLEQRAYEVLDDDEDDDNNDAASSRKMAPLLEKFCIQPLWFGGVYNNKNNNNDQLSGSSSNSAASGLDMLHQCPAVSGAKMLTDDGLWWGGDPTQAQEVLSDPSLPRIYTGFDFKFFVQATKWNERELEHEIVLPSEWNNNQQQDSSSSGKDYQQYGTWFPCHVAKEVLFKSRDRMGGGAGRRAMPLWTEIMQLLGGNEYLDIYQELYKDKL